MSDPCPQAWHGGLDAGLLRECRLDAGHRGQHRHASGDLVWSGKLTEAEHARAVELREAREAGGAPPVDT